MRTLTDSAVLDIWERGHGAAESMRSMLAAALPGSDREHWAGISIGERDAALLRLRRMTFGARLPGCVDCAGCGARLEFELDTDHLLAGLRAPTQREFTIGNGARFRLPDCSDLLAIACCDDADAAERQLLQRCCLDEAGDREWPPALRTEIDAQMMMRDEAGQIHLQFDCDSCGRAWTEGLDIASYFREEIEQHARRLLDEVHCLAAHYGWEEERIIAMSAPRRAAYLQRCLA
jgi:hypothetical protein